MFINISIHHPKPEYEEVLIDSMHRYGETVTKAAGAREVHTLKDARTGILVGLAIWDSKDDYLAARPALMETVKDDDFDLWEAKPIEGYQLENV